MPPDRLRVLYSFPHPLGEAGINTTAWQQVAAISALGAQVTVYCSSLATELPSGVDVVETLVLRGRRIPHRALGLRRAYDYHDSRVAHRLAESAEEFDVVHAWPRSCLTTFATAGQRGVTSFREVPSAHTATAFADAERAGASVGVPLPRGSPHHFDERRLREEETEFARADFLLIPSDYVRRTFLEKGVAADKLIRHHYGHDANRFFPETSGVERPFTAVFVGRGEPAKGLHLALQAWSASGAGSTGRFLIVGNLLPAYRKVLAPLLEDPSVECLGFVTDVPAVLRRSDVLLLPSFTEGSALVALEAAACGVVPLVSESSGTPITHDVDGLLHQVGDVQTLTDQLRRMATDPVERGRLSQAAMRTSAAFTWSAAGAELIQAYREGLSRSHQRTA